MAGIRSLSNF